MSLINPLFGFTTTAAEVIAGVDLTGRHAIVTCSATPAAEAPAPLPPTT